MQYLSGLDYVIICVYFSMLVGLGIYLKKRASASLEDYFIGGRNLPWWALGISGMAAWLDITGTMIVTSFLFLLGPRGLFIEFRGGAVLVAAVTLLWAGKWHRRSKCITGAEWMIYRFGNGLGGKFARLAASIGQIAITIGMLGYMVKGVGLFLSMFLPFSPFVCALILIMVASVYTMASGFYGVVFTDIFQSGIILLAVIGISVMAVLKISGYDGDLAALTQSVTGSKDWLSSKLSWKTSMPEGTEYEAYKNMAMFAFFYLVRNVFAGMAGGAEPKYFGARNDRACGKLTFLNIFMMMFRWPLMLAFAVLGIFLVKDMFPDQAVLGQAAALIKQHVGTIEASRWADTLSAIVHQSQNYPAELLEQLQRLLGENWKTSLLLLSYEGTVNPERILPAVILHNIPMGFRGLILVALIAASMSTFDSTVNMTTGFFTRDIYQGFIRPKATNRELIYISWFFIVLLVVVGFVFGYTIKSINDIWGWIIMGLGAGLLVPSFLRLCWWRFNGGGFALGTAAGITAAVLQRALRGYMEVHLSSYWYGVYTDERYFFSAMVVAGFIGSIIGAYLTRPTEPAVLEHFYKTTRPFGVWGHLKRTLSPSERAAVTCEHRNDIIALPFVLAWQITLFMLPMQLMIRTFWAFGITLAVHVVSLIGMYIFWYRMLPAANEKTGQQVEG